MVVPISWLRSRICLLTASITELMFGPWKESNSAVTHSSFSYTGYNLTECNQGGENCFLEACHFPSLSRIPIIWSKIGWEINYKYVSALNTTLTERLYDQIPFTWLWRLPLRMMDTSQKQLFSELPLLRQTHYTTLYKLMMLLGLNHFLCYNWYQLCLKKSTIAYTKAWGLSFNIDKMKWA